MPISELRRRWLSHCALVACLLAAALAIGLWRVNDSGPLWPDAPRYANSGAMIRDWLLSGQYTAPLSFAKQNYVQYPAFSIPFHPPGYPALLGTWFTLTGTSYTSARVFVALCGGLGACIFALWHRQAGSGFWPALGAGLLLLSTPEVAKWSRCTMSEVPSLAIFLAASWVFTRWIERPRAALVWLAFALAGLAFFSRVTTAGLLPGWFLFALVLDRQRLKSPHLWCAAALYLLVCGAYVKWAAQFATYEVHADGRGDALSWTNAQTFGEMLLLMLPAGTTLLALAALPWVIRQWRVEQDGQRKAMRTLAIFWLCALVSYLVFKLATPTSVEVRHLFAIWPALAGVAVASLPLAPRWLGWAGIALAIGINAYGLRDLPRGVVGYQQAAETLAREEAPGNILLCCVEDQELIFRFRAAAGTSDRQLLRGDRVLAIRLPGYAKKEAEILVQTPEEVLDILQRGRVRYLVTCTFPDSGDYVPPEIRLAHETALQSSSLQRIGGGALLVQYSELARTGEYHIWRNRKELADGPSELEVVIPTSGMTLKPSR